MRKAYPTGWVEETCRGSQVVICPDFHLIDWLQSQWGLCVPLFREGLLLGAGRRREHPSLFRATAQLGPQASLSFKARSSQHLLFSEDLFLSGSEQLLNSQASSLLKQDLGDKNASL